MHQAHFHDGAFFYPLRVYYEDTDAGGVVYHSNFLNFAERARTECLRHMGLEQGVLKEKEQFIFVVSKAEIAFKRPGRLDDALVVETRLQSIRKARMSMRQIVRKDETVLAEMTIEIACVSLSNFRSMPVPEHIVTIFAQHLPFEMIKE
ncbi:MAG: tol-pal system-associated acyl-CoA thioesterase [Alphaproteobacteria bacterium]|nr:tol-pal system-associated acyl-CoA thioesterase [Alphaproteobacteria bacterium]